MLRPGPNALGRTLPKMDELDTAAVARLFADRSRLAMLDLLHDRGEHPLTALAREAGVGLSTVAEHLERLERAGLVVSRREGRHRLVRLAGAEVAGAYEALAGLHARSGAREWFGRFGVELSALPPSRRPLLRVCMDWTERREHLAGSLGATICSTVLDEGWVVRLPGSRALRVTPLGEAKLRELGWHLQERAAA